MPQMKKSAINKLLRQLEKQDFSGETRQVMPSELADTFIQLLERHGHHHQLIALTFFDRVYEAGLSLPANFLPDFLNFCTNRQLFFRFNTDKALAIAGVRGRWLIEQNPHWQWESLDDATRKLTAAERNEIDVGWKHKSIWKRIDALAKLAKHDPDAAYSLVIESWDEEKSTGKWRFLLQLLPPQTQEQFDFYKKLLTDRDNFARSHAEAQLSSIPEFDNLRRIRAFAEKVLVPGENSKTIRVVPMEKFTSEMKANDFTKKPPSFQYGMDEQTWWVVQSLKKIPVTYWESHFQMSPQELFAAVADDPYYVAVLLGWAEGMHHLKDDKDYLVWGSLILDVLHKLEKESPISVNTQYVDVMQRLAKRSPEYFLQKFKAGEKVDRATLVWEWVAHSYPWPWTEEFTSIFFDYIEKTLNTWLLHIYVAKFPAEYLPKVRLLFEKCKMSKESNSEVVEQCQIRLELRTTFDDLLDKLPRC